MPPALRNILVRISSPWVSIALLVVIFAHETLGSAFYPIRQSFELNEMQWFNGWFSLSLWGLLCVCMITASLVRVPWTWARGGAHLTHLSVVLLVIACAIYFSNKVEGETLVLRRTIDLADRDGNHALLLPNPGHGALLGDATARVESIIPRWSVLTPDGKPAQAWAAMVKVTFPGGRPFTATLIEGRPELTQYTMQGRTPISYLPAISAVDAVDGVMHVRGTDGAVKVEAPIATGITNANGWELTITAIDADWPLLAKGEEGKKATLVSFTVKTPDGQQSGDAVLGRPELTRYQRARTKVVPDARLASATLVSAPMTRAYHQDRFALWWRLLPPSGQPDEHRGYTVHPLVDLPRYHARGERADGRSLAIDAGANDVAEGKPQTVFAVTGFMPYADAAIVTREDSAAPADPQLDVVFSAEGLDATPRLVRLSPDPSDIDSTALCWLRPADQAGCDAVMAKLAARAALPVGDDTAGGVRVVLLTKPDGRDELLTVAPGQAPARVPFAADRTAHATLGGGAFTVQVRDRYEHPRQEVVPAPVPPERRQSRMAIGMSQSWIEVEARTGATVERRWVAFSPFPHLPVDLGQRDTVLGGYAPRPTILDLPGGARAELMYGRMPFALPGPIWMEGFEVPRRPGANDPMEFFCTVGYGGGADGGTKDEAAQHAVIHMNHPLEWQDTFFFQAGWDPGSQAISVLGVGNRPAGGFMLLAAILLGIGMIWSGAGMARQRSVENKTGAADNEKDQA